MSLITFLRTSSVIFITRQVKRTKPTRKTPGTIFTGKQKRETKIISNVKTMMLIDNNLNFFCALVYFEEFILFYQLIIIDFFTHPGKRINRFGVLLNNFFDIE